jgi:hypothetical protein
MVLQHAKPPANISSDSIVVAIRRESFVGFLALLVVEALRWSCL